VGCELVDGCKNSVTLCSLVRTRVEATVGLGQELLQCSNATNPASCPCCNDGGVLQCQDCFCFCCVAGLSSQHLRETMLPCQQQQGGAACTSVVPPCQLTGGSRRGLCLARWSRASGSALSQASAYPEPVPDRLQAKTGFLLKQGVHKPSLLCWCSFCGDSCGYQFTGLSCCSDAHGCSSMMRCR